MRQEKRASAVEASEAASYQASGGEFDHEGGFMAGIGNFMDNVKDGVKDMGKKVKDAGKELGIVEQSAQGSVDYISDKPIHLKSVLAERFDFTFNQHFFKHNIKVDKYGERITSWSNKVGRIVSRDCMSFEPNMNISDS